MIWKILVVVIVFMVGIQCGKCSEVERLKELGLYPSNEEIIFAENCLYGESLPSEMGSKVRSKK